MKWGARRSHLVSSRTVGIYVLYINILLKNSQSVFEYFRQNAHENIYAGKRGKQGLQSCYATALQFITKGKVNAWEKWKKKGIQTEVLLFGARGGTTSSQASYPSFFRRRKNLLIPLLLLSPQKVKPFVGAPGRGRVLRRPQTQKNTDIQFGCLYFWCARRDLNPHVRIAH